MNFYCITIVRAGDCLRSVQNIDELGDCLIKDKKVALKIYKQQLKGLFSGDSIFLYENGHCIKRAYL